jgi:Mrp family chromosome partitioning ATPase
MTRIFEALKKVQSTRKPAAAEVAREVPGRIPASPDPVGRPVRPGAATIQTFMPRGSAMPAQAAVALPVRSAPLADLPDLPEDVVREMVTLRMHLESALQSQQTRVVILLSALRGEGTSTVAMQFASTLARDERLRVLLADMNARRPALDPVRMRSLPHADAVGSSGGGIDLLPVSAEQLDTGLVPPAAARDIVDSLNGQYDWIIFDGPPVLESPDAAALAAVADGAVIIIQAGRAKRPVLNRAVELLRKAGARPLGSVLNRRLMEIPEFIYRRI